MARPKKQHEQTTAPTPEEVSQNQVAPDVPSASTTEKVEEAHEKLLSGLKPEEIVDNGKIETLGDIAKSVTATEILLTTETTPTVKIEPVIEFRTQEEPPKYEERFTPDENKVLVNKEALYRMLVGLARGHTQSYTFERAKQMVGKLFGVGGEEFQNKWEEIKRFIG